MIPRLLATAVFLRLHCSSEQTVDCGSSIEGESTGTCAASSGEGSASLRQYELCERIVTVRSPAPKVGNMDVIMIAASLTHTAEVCSKKPERWLATMNLRAAVMFQDANILKRSRDILEDEFDEFKPSWGISREDWNIYLHRFFNCPSLRVKGHVKAIWCKVSCSQGGDGWHVRGTYEFVAHDGHHQGELVILCRLPTAVFETCSESDSEGSGDQGQLNLLVQMEMSSRKRGQWNISIPASLCETHMTKRRVTACSQPLNNYPYLANAHPQILHDWLTYHRNIGIDHFMIYDVDGTFATELKPFIESGFVSYYPSWADQISETLGHITRSFKAPLCVELYAYAHCLVLNNVISDWVALIHSPDEYLMLPREQSANTGALTGLLDVFNDIHDNVTMLQVAHVAFGRSSDDIVGPGSVIRSSTLRQNTIDPERGSPLINPTYCISTFDPHACTGNLLQKLPRKNSAIPDGLGSLLVDHPHLQEEPMRRERFQDLLVGRHILEKDPDMGQEWRKRKAQHHIAPSVLRVNHYVEMLPRDIGRCKKLKSNEPCHINDTGLVWAASMMSH